jgi:hypothetical protein
MNDPIFHSPVWPVIPAKLPSDISKFNGKSVEDPNNHVVRKIGPQRNKIKQMRKQNTEDTQYKRDTDLRGSPNVGYVNQRNCQVLSLLLSSKMKGYNLQQNLL